MEPWSPHTEAFWAKNCNFRTRLIEETLGHLLRWHDTKLHPEAESRLYADCEAVECELAGSNRISQSPLVPQSGLSLPSAGVSMAIRDQGKNKAEPVRGYRCGQFSDEAPDFSD